MYLVDVFYSFRDCISSPSLFFFLFGFTVQIDIISSSSSSDLFFQFVFLEF